MKMVTVIMPVYNGERYLEEAVNSILNQTYENFELLLIDDASSDNSIELISEIRDKRIRVIRNAQNMGIAAARNIGLDASNSKYIALLDQDDIALPYRLEHEVKYLDENPQVDVVGGHQRSIDCNGTDLERQWSVYLNPAYIKAYLMLNDTVVNGSTMFRKAFVDRYNIRYRENQYGAEDYRFWAECSLHGVIKNLDEVMLLWRCGHGNTTYSMLNTKREERRAAIRSIQQFALEGNGIFLQNKELDLISRVFFDDGIVENEQQLKGLYYTLKNIAEQAVDNHLENAQEVVTMCRKRFGEKVGKAFYLWNQE